jgi:hypothetical protein
MSTAKLLLAAGRVAGLGNYLPILSTREVAANRKESTLARSRHVVHLRGSLASGYMHKRLLAFVDELELGGGAGEPGQGVDTATSGTRRANPIVLENLSPRLKPAR